MTTTRWIRLATVLATTAVAAAAWAVVAHAAGIALTVRFRNMQAETVSIGEVIGATLVACGLGWAALELIESRVRNPRATWVVLAVTVLAVSLGLPISAATTTSGALGLVVLHIVVAATAIPLFARTAAAGGVPVAVS